MEACNASPLRGFGFDPGVVNNEPLNVGEEVTRTALCQETVSSLCILLPPFWHITPRWPASFLFAALWSLVSLYSLLLFYVCIFWAGGYCAPRPGLCSLAGLFCSLSSGSINNN